MRWIPSKLLLMSCLLLSTCGVPFVPFVQAEIPISNPRDPCAGLSKALVDCSFFKCERPTGTTNKDFVVMHAVDGLSPDGTYCKHYQNLPDGNILFCQYTEPMRYLVARMAGSDENLLNAYEEAAVSRAVNDQCQVITPEQLQMGGS